MRIFTTGAQVSKKQAPLRSLGREAALFGLRLLPKSVRYPALRRLSSIDEAELGRVDSVHIASTVGEYIQAAALVHDSYVARGIMQSHGSGVRMTHYLALPSTTVFVAVVQGQVVGTVSLVVDSGSGLPMEKIYGKEVQAIRVQGRVVAEVGALSLSPAHRRVGLTFLLYKALYQCAAKLLGVDDLVIAVHPKAEDIYRANLLFERLGPVKNYPDLERSALAVGLHLRLRESVDTFTRAFGHLPQAKSNPLYMYLREEAQIHLPSDATALQDLKRVQSRASMKLAALRPDVVMGLETGAFGRLRAEMQGYRCETRVA